MFHKAFRIKSNVIIKGSERKHIKHDLSFQYPTLTQHDIDEMIPNKAPIHCVRCEGVRGGGVCSYYIHDGDPILFTHEGMLYPTVYTLWHYPDMLRSVTTTEAVGDRLQNGADLMLPGVATVAKGGFSLAGIAKGQPLAVNCVGNRFPLAVGISMMSCDEMLANGMRGKLVEVLHVYRDHLWLAGSKRQLPLLIMGMQQSFVPTSDQSDHSGGSSDEDEPVGVEQGQSSTTSTDATVTDSSTTKAPATLQKVGGARRGKKRKPRAKEDPIPTATSPAKPMSKTTEKKIKKLYKQHHKNMTNQQWRKMMGKDLPRREESEYDDLRLGHPMMRKETHLSKEVSLAKITEREIKEKLELESKKAEPESPTSFTRASKKLDISVKDEFDLINEALQDMILRFREVHKVSDATPYVDSLEAIEMRSFANGKGGKLFFFLSRADRDPFGCIVEITADKEAFATHMPGPGCELDHFDWWREEPLSNNIGILTGEGLCKFKTIPDSPLWIKPKQALSKMEVLHQVFVNRFLDKSTDEAALAKLVADGRSPAEIEEEKRKEKEKAADLLKAMYGIKSENSTVSVESARAMTDPWYSGPPDSSIKPLPPAQIAPRFESRKETKLERDMEEAVEKYLLKQMSKETIPIRQPTKQESATIYNEFVSNIGIKDLLGIAKIGQRLRAAQLNPDSIQALPGSIRSEVAKPPSVDSDSSSESSEEVVRSKYKGDSSDSDTEGLGWYHLPKENPTPPESSGESSPVTTPTEDWYRTPSETANTTVAMGTTSDPMQDELVRECFYKAVRSKVKPNDIPLLTSTFYRSYMMEVCPIEFRLDIKKSSYKKLSKFLTTLQSEGVIEIASSGGVETITKIDFSHESVRSFRPNLTKSAAHKPVSAPSKPVNKGITVEEMWSPSAHLAPIFSPRGHHKSSTLTAAQVREIVTLYVKQNHLVSEDDPKNVTLDPILYDAFKRKGFPPMDKLPWPQLFRRVFDEMRQSFGICHGSNTPIIRHSLPKVKLTVCRRANKTVTVVDNLDTYGIPALEVAKNIQKQAACHSAMNVVPGRPGLQQVLIQGNQIKATVKLIQDTYGLPLKYIEAIDKVKPPKKKGDKK